MAYAVFGTTRASRGVKRVLDNALSPAQLLAGVAVAFAAVQGALALESADPCRLSKRKMNMILFFELLEFIFLLISEVYSFIELRKALRTSFTWLHWVAPCLLAAGLLELAVDVYFTLAVLAKSRISWLPMSAIGEERMGWGLLPFVVTLSGAISLIGWRVQWWWPNKILSDTAKALAIAKAEQSMSTGVMGFSVGWVVAVSAIVFLVVLICDLGEDGPSYIFSLPYLWRPDEWLGDNPGTVKVWYRTPTQELLDNQFDAAAVLDSTLTRDGPLADEESKRDFLERAPLHVGNAIVGDDQKNALREESSSAETLHVIILVSEHLTVLPLLFTVLAAVINLKDGIDSGGLNVLEQLTDAVIVLAFIEVAIGIKNVVWGIRGNSESDRAVPQEVAVEP